MSPMPTKPGKPNKRDAIVDAMLDLVVERGFHDAPMSVLARRAGASAGVIYHHFRSKDEIIQALYGRVSALKYASIFAGYSPELDPHEAFLLLWTNAYTFHREHRQELRFLEQYTAAGFPCQPAVAPDDPNLLAFQQRFTPQSQGGVLRDLPPAVLEEMSIGLAIRLASLPDPLGSADLRLIAESVWEAVRA